MKRKLTHKQREARLTTIVHGTTKGYRKESYRGLDPCDECKAAWTLENTKRRRANKKNPLR